MRISLLPCLLISGVILAESAPVAAAWKAGDAGIAAAIKDERIAGALAAVNRIDEAAIDDNHAAFAELLADDLAVNNPQNGVSVRGATTKRSAASQVSYSRYDRVIEYAGVRGDMVILMGEEIVLPKGNDLTSAREVHRRFTDLWKPTNGGWKLTARQATVITRP